MAQIRPPCDQIVAFTRLFSLSVDRLIVFSINRLVVWSILTVISEIRAPVDRPLGDAGRIEE